MKLTPAQKRVLEFIQQFLQTRGYPPTVREVAEKFGYHSPLSAKQHIDALVKKGYLKRSPLRARGIEIVGVSSPDVIRIPVVGSIRAGEPILATENIEEQITLNRELFRVDDDVFGLRVVGESMKGAGIFEGDIVIVKPGVMPENGEIVVALIGEEATVKRFFREGNSVRLQPENPDMEVMVVRAEEFNIIGKVVGLLRRF